MKKLVIASHNEGKVKEFRELLAPLGVEVVSAKELNLPEPEETGETFAENAELKSKAAAELSQLPALSDDSGLCVEVLGGAPGIYSARWAGPNKDFAAAMQKIHDEILDVEMVPEGSSAYFISVLSLTTPSGKTEVFKGRIEGALTFPPRGKHGFGYDPIFVPHDYQETFGEMDSAKKHAMSHRARAFEKLIQYLKKEKAA